MVLKLPENINQEERNCQNYRQNSEQIMDERTCYYTELYMLKKQTQTYQSKRFERKKGLKCRIQKNTIYYDTGSQRGIEQNKAK